MISSNQNTKEREKKLIFSTSPPRKKIKNFYRKNQNFVGLLYIYFMD